MQSVLVVIICYVIIYDCSLRAHTTQILFYNLFVRERGTAQQLIAKITSELTLHWLPLNLKTNGNFLKRFLKITDLVYLALEFIYIIFFTSFFPITATTYWTSGMYDSSRNLWRWTANNVPLPPFAPWGNGFPSNPNSLLRVLLYFTNRFDAFWRTVSYTQLHRYICEVQVSYVQLEVLRSYSIQAINFIRRNQ